MQHLPDRDRGALAGADDRACCVTSLLPAEQFTATAGGRSFSDPSQLTATNYSALLDNDAITDSLVHHGRDRRRRTVLLVIVAALAGYAFAWMEFPGRDWLFIVVVALLVVPVQVALIPMFKLYDAVGIFDTVLGLVLFHTAFGLPFAIFLLRNFFVGIPQDLLEAARIDGAVELRIFFRLVLPLGAAGDRVARDLPVPVGVERPARRADVRPVDRSRSPSRSSRRCGSSAPTST